MTSRLVPQSLFQQLESEKIDGQEALNAVISALQDAFERLAASEQRYRELYDNAPDMYHTLDLQGNFMEFNPKHTEILGFSKEELQGAPVAMIIPESALPRLAEGFRQMLEDGKLDNYEVDLKKKDGSLMTVEVHAKIYPAADGHPQEVRCIMRDVTERKRMDEQLRQSQKMESLGLLAGGVAHDFNNILSAIMCYTDMVIMKVKPGDPMTNHLQEIQKAAERASHLTRQLLVFSRRQGAEPKVLSVNDLVMDADKMLRRLLRENIELVIKAAPDLGMVRVDPGQMQQVIVNLVVNARDATPDKGKLAIQTANVRVDKGYTDSHFKVSAGMYVMLSVSDSGVGMTEEVKSHLFEPFFTTKEVGKGTGLGLSTCYGIVAQSGGHITVESEPNRGTTFRIYLPLVEEEASRWSLRTDPGAIMPAGCETVLLVEDEASLREIAAQVLQQQGYTVLEASNGVEALNKARAHHASPVHLVLTDVVMPLMGGRELVDQLKALHPETRIIYTSGYPGEAIGEASVLENRAAFLQKPYTPALLSHKVREVLDAAPVGART